jgi:hypothetical protein
MLEKAIHMLVPCQVGIKLIQCAFITVDCVRKENVPASSVARLGTTISHLLTMERFLLNSDCVFCDLLVTVLRVHISTCHLDGSLYCIRNTSHISHSFQ